MSVLENAIAMEVEGERFYRDLADSASSDGFKKIFTMLADDEIRHRRVFEKLAAASTVTAAEYESHEEASSFFKEMHRDDFTRATDQLEVYRRAVEMEKEGIAYYRQQLQDAADSREILGKIIAEEESHLEILSDLVEFVAQPERWVEDAEFGEREEY